MNRASNDSSVSRASGTDHAPDNGLTILGRPFGLEKVYDYESGGHHPVHLTEVLHQRYKVIHKLGSGGYANVWLCVDTSAAPSYHVALKIIMAEASTKDCPELRVKRLLHLGLDQGPSSTHFCLPLDQFEIKGPNGLHYAFVYPVLGPRVSKLTHLLALEDVGVPLRRIALQAAQAMATLHTHGISHGDFRPANILAHISGLDGLTENEIFDLLGKPETTDVISVSEDGELGDGHNLNSAPRYLAYPIDWEDVMSDPTKQKFVKDEACVIDFGECFEISAPPEELGIPQVYCSPEYSIERKIGVGSDLWALGCTLFEIRTGRKLFDTFDDDVDEHLWKVCKVLGKLPEPWWSTTWKYRSEFFEDEVGVDGQVVEVAKTRALTSDGSELLVPERETCVNMEEQRGPRSLRDALSQGLCYENRFDPEGSQRDISQKEIDVFSYLLSKLLTLSPGDRISAQDALEHEWFRFGSE